jgi:hypothetical protein
MINPNWCGPLAPSIVRTQMVGPEVVTFVGGHSEQQRGRRGLVTPKVTFAQLLKTPFSTQGYMLYC